VDSAWTWRRTCCQACPPASNVAVAAAAEASARWRGAASSGRGTPRCFGIDRARSECATPLTQTLAQDDQEREEERERAREIGGRERTIGGVEVVAVLRGGGAVAAESEYEGALIVGDADVDERATVGSEELGSVAKEGVEAKGVAADSEHSIHRYLERVGGDDLAHPCSCCLHGLLCIFTYNAHHSIANV